MTAARTRLCIVSPRQDGGGAEYQIECLIDMLTPLDRYEIFYLARHVAAQAQSSAYRVVKIGRGDRMPRLGYLADAVPLYRALRRIAPDVIYQRVGGGYTGICASYAHRHRTPMIWHVASDADVIRQTLIAGRNPLRPFLEKRSIEYGVRHASRIVVQTQHQADLLQGNYGRKADLIVANFHPLPQETIDKTGRQTVVWIGNFKPLKQPDAFVRLAAQLHDLNGVRFVMVGAPATGSGDRKWSDELTSSIRATANLEHLGWQSQREVNELLARSHVYVNTSAFEGFANTFIQAWMRDAPVVSLHVNPDGVLDHEGVGIHAGSEKKLAHAVRMLLTDAALHAEYAARARRYAMQAHSMQNAQRLVELIDACALGAPRGADG